MKNVKEIRLSTLLDQRENVRLSHEQVLEAVGMQDDKMPTETHRSMIEKYRGDAVALDNEIAELTSDIENDRAAADRAIAARKHLGSVAGGLVVDDEGAAGYTDFYSYARDVVMTRQGIETAKISAQFGRNEIDAARERLSLLERTPANTLTSNLGGLNPPQHIAQIFQVINKSRSLVASALSTGLERGSLTYPKVTTRPVVAVQASEKTEAGNTGLVVDMLTASASTYLGGGDISWQQLNWSTPDALQLWFDLAAADYALKTETAAGDAMTDSAYTNRISSQITLDTYAHFLTGIAAGAAKVFSVSGRQADTIYMAEDAFWAVFGMTSDQFAQFATVGVSGIGPLNIVRTRGLATGEVIVGDSQGLLVAETPGAPVELRVVEPAIGGLEVGLIGAFAAAVVDNGAFSLVTTAS